MSFLDNLTTRLPFGKKPPITEYFFALIVGHSEITGAVWSIYGSQLDILGQAALSYEGTDDLVDKAYKALDQALGALEIEASKVLFGVPETWVIDDNLKEPYLKLLQKMLKEYDLQPMAYVTTTNALSHLLQKQEGAPPTCLVLGIGDYVEATLIRGGRVIEDRSAKRGDGLFDDVEKVLRQFTEAESLPSRILLYSTKREANLAKVKDELMSYPWMQKLSFLHFPKIDLLDGNILTEATVLAGAVEINPQVDLKHSFLAKKHFSEPKKGNLFPQKRVEEEDLGFVKGDIGEKPKLEDPTKSAIFNEEGRVPPEKPVPQETEENAEPKPPSRKIALSRMHPHQIAERESTEEESAPVSHHPKVYNLSTLCMKFPKKVLHYLATGGAGMLGKLALLPVILLLLAGVYVYFVKAQVNILVEPRILEKDTEVVADPKASSVDEEKKIIPGGFLETAVTGSGKASATGKKQIGDPARGKVVVYNLTSNKVSFSQGSLLTDSRGLKFTLDSSVQVASQSASVGADLTTIIKPGKSDSVGVSASAIGGEGNLPAGTDLTFGNYQKSQVIARVEEALAGGTSKDVTVITSEDQKKLQAQVLDELRQKAEKELQGKLPEGKKVISEALTAVDSKYNFSKKVNDQANEFSLSATVKFKGTTYTDADLNSIVAKLVETNVPEGFEINLADSETQADIVKVEKDGKLIFKARFKAKLMPKYNLDDLKKQIRGQSVSQAVDHLKELENVIGAEIKLSPNLPAALSRLPWWEKNIDIKVTPK